MRLFDTHAHLLDEQFDMDRPAILGRFEEDGIALMLEACTAAEDAPRVLRFAQENARIYAALGTHPHDAKDMQEAHYTLLEELLQDKNAVAVGEIGLDYHYDFSPRDVQREVFARQLSLAHACHLPVVLHMREATEDMLDILRAHKDGLTGVMHCFTGSYDTAKICLDLGLFIGFGGALTFQNARRAVEAAVKLPLSRIILETDCPYMAPVPFRGKRNEPAHIRLVCEKLAEIKGVSADEIAAITLENGKKLFKLA